MKKDKTRKTLEVVRERERESKSLKKIDFICSEKNKENSQVKRNKNRKINIIKNIKKRMEYELKKVVSKIKIANTSFENHILSFLRACKACSICTNRRIGEKDKYA